MTHVPVRVRPSEDHRRTHDLVSLISLVGHQLEQRMDQALSRVGLTARQYQALVHIAATPGKSRGELGRSLGVSPQAAGSTSRRLREVGLIDFSDAAPGRPVSFLVTESGRAALREAVSIVGATGQDILAVLPSSTVESTAEAMQTLALQSV